MTQRLLLNNIGGTGLDFPVTSGLQFLLLGKGYNNETVYPDSSIEGNNFNVAGASYLIIGDDYVEKNNSGTVINTAKSFFTTDNMPFTLSAYIKVPFGSYTDTNRTLSKVLLSNGVYDNHSGLILGLRGFDTTWYTFIINARLNATNTNNNNLGSGASGFPCDNWALYSIIYDGTTMSSYINGTFIQNIAYSFLAPENVLGSTVLSRNANDGGVSAGTDPLYCKFKCIAFYDRALTASEIQSISSYYVYNNIPKDGDLIFHYDFSEGSESNSSLSNKGATDTTLIVNNINNGWTGSSYNFGTLNSNWFNMIPVDLHPFDELTFEFDVIRNATGVGWESLFAIPKVWDFESNKNLGRHVIADAIYTDIGDLTARTNVKIHVSRLTYKVELFIDGVSKGERDGTQSKIDFLFDTPYLSFMKGRDTNLKATNNEVFSIKVYNGLV